MRPELIRSVRKLRGETDRIFRGELPKETCSRHPHPSSELLANDINNV